MIGIVSLTETQSEVIRPIAWNMFSWIRDVLGMGGDSVGSVWLMFAACLLSAVIAYFIGSINPAIIISHRVYHDDIRAHGSGNAGATNTLRTYGKKTAAIIFSLDLLKTVIAIIIGSLIVTREIGGAIAGLFVIVGHMFPIYYKFKGGKGVACLAIVALMLSPISFAILICVFIAIVALTKYVSLGSVMVVMLYPMMNQAFYRQNGMITFTGICIMILVVFMHRENIKRLLAGTESKISFGGKKKKEQDDGGEANGNDEQA